MIDKEGAKLVEMSMEMADRIKREQPGIRVLPLSYGRPAAILPLMHQSYQGFAERPGRRPSGRNSTLTIRTEDGKVLPNAKVEFLTIDMYTFFSDGTDEKGRISLPIGGLLAEYETLYVWPPDWRYQGLLIPKEAWGDLREIVLKAVSPSYAD
jgi:hypothetical protein